MADADVSAALPQLVQQLAALAAVALATGWLTARWLLRRRRGCGGDCSRCTSAGRTPCALPNTLPGPGVRPPGLRVVQPGGNVTGPGDV